MPIYEFRCQACGRKFSALVGMVAAPDDTRCPDCGAPDARKLVSRFTRGRSEDDRMDEMADRLDQFGDPESGTEMRRMAREMGKAMDEDVSEEMEELAEADLSGEAWDD